MSRMGGAGGAGGGLKLAVAFLYLSIWIVFRGQLGAAQTCGSEVGGALCADGLCCSQFGYCGSTSAYCGDGCQSQCVVPAPPPPPAVSTSGLDKTLNESLFNALFPNRNQFYTYNSLILAGNAYPIFGTGKCLAVNLREIAAFAAHVQQETAGLVYITEIDKSNRYCDATDVEYPCAFNKSYYGRGPLQLSWNYNYGPASASVGANILANPDLVAADPVLAFKTALWFWTTPSGTIPSIHNVITGRYRPTKEDLKLGRKPGFGLTINIINGGIECGKVTAQATNRVTYFKQFAKQLGVDPGPNLTCDKMTPF